MNSIVEPTFGSIPLHLVRESATNPRKNFNQTKLEELASSIRMHGVGQPILVRPLPAVEGEEHFVEIVAGARRYRASVIAECKTIPAIVRGMSDLEVLQFQLIENLQREDVHEIEEAEGYQRLMSEHNMAADDVAAKVGKSRSYIYGRLKLCRLAPDVRELCFDGTIDASTALLIARIPIQKLQIQAANEIIAGGVDWRGELKTDAQPLSFRKTQEHLKERFMLDLLVAPFPITDTKLIECAGACSTCPNRTGNQPEIYDDLNPDVCTDPDCFAAKREAYGKRVIKLARKDGIPVHEGDEGVEMYESGDFTTLSDALFSFRRLIDEESEDKEVGEVLATEQLPKPAAYAVIDGKAEPLFEQTAIQLALEKAGICETELKYAERVKAEAKSSASSDAAPKVDSYQVQQERKRAVAKQHTDFNAKVYDAIRAKQQDALTIHALRAIAWAVIGKMTHEPLQAFWEMYDLAELSKEERIEYINETASIATIDLMIIDAVMLPRIQVNTWNVSDKYKVEDSKELLNLAKCHDIDVSELRAKFIPAEESDKKVAKAKPVKAGKKVEPIVATVDDGALPVKAADSTIAKPAKAKKEKSKPAEKETTAKPVNPAAAWPFPTSTRP